MNVERVLHSLIESRTLRPSARSGKMRQLTPVVPIANAGGADYWRRWRNAISVPAMQIASHAAPEQKPATTSVR